MELRPIQEITSREIVELLRSALTSEGFRPRVIGDFVAAIDWSRPEMADAATVALLGKLTLWATRYSEGDLDARTFAAKVNALVPDAPSPITTKVITLYPGPQSPPEVQAAEPRQTELDIHRVPA